MPGWHRVTFKSLPPAPAASSAENRCRPASATRKRPARRARSRPDWPTSSISIWIENLGILEYTARPAVDAPLRRVLLSRPPTSSQPSGRTKGDPMNTLLRGMVRAVAETFDLPGPILEVGSYQVEDQEDIADLRPLFPGRPYVGLDMRPGPGVDLVGDVEALPQADASVGTVLALETFEHVRHFWKRLRRNPPRAPARRRPARRRRRSTSTSTTTRTTTGASRPTPSNCCSKPTRARSSAGTGRPRGRPTSGAWPSARNGRRSRRRSSAATRRCCEQYARMPLPWARRLRYRVGRLFFGRRPFAPWLDREMCRSEWS